MNWSRCTSGSVRPTAIAVACAVLALSAGSALAINQSGESKNMLRLGHTDLQGRREAVRAGQERVLTLRDRLVGLGLPVPRLVLGGTPTFPAHAALDEPAVEPSPGTCILHDVGYGTQFPDLLDQPLGDILVKGGTTKRVPFALTLTGDGEGLEVNAILTYSLIPKPAPALLNGYLKTLSSEAERERTTRLITDYAEPRILTFRTKSL